MDGPPAQRYLCHTWLPWQLLLQFGGGASRPRCHEETTEEDQREHDQFQAVVSRADLSSYYGVRDIVGV